jgi:hypothetical protein
MQTDCAAKRKNRDGATNATKHANQTSERLTICQSIHARIEPFVVSIAFWHADFDLGGNVSMILSLLRRLAMPRWRLRHAV